MRQKMISSVKNSINIYNYVRILITVAFGKRKLLNKMIENNFKKLSLRILWLFWVCILPWRLFSVLYLHDPYGFASLSLKYDKPSHS